MIELLAQGTADIQQTAKDIQAAAKTAEAVTPYMWEIVAFCFILASHFVTNLIRKQRWFPAFLCKIKSSRCGEYSYRQLKPIYLIAFAMSASYVGVSWSLFQRYDNAEQIYVVTGLICVMQWLIVEAVFKLAPGTKLQGAAEVLQGNLYVPEDSTVIMKTIAKATGGGVDKRK